MSDKLKSMQADMVAAMKAGDKPRKEVLSLLVSRVKLMAKDDKRNPNREPTDADVIDALSKTIKETKDAREQFLTGGRDVSKHDFEITTLSAYLPAQMTDADLEAKIVELLATAEDPKKARGVVMTALKAQHGGSYDPATANAIMGRLLA